MSSPVFAESAAGRSRAALLKQGLFLEYATLGWNVVAVGLLLLFAAQTGSVATLGFGLDSFLEIGASLVVVWQLRDGGTGRQRQALRLLSLLFAGLAVFIGATAGMAFLHHTHPGASGFAALWLVLTVVAMLALAAGKHRVGRRLGNPVLLAESRVTLVDAYLAAAVLTGVLLNGYRGWWWADPLAGVVIVLYGVRESRHAWAEAGS